ncbi:methyltransferase [bacterium]|nr:methyltransferase [bacterium]NBX78256.1 methyltransferase [bacterium]
MRFLFWGILFLGYTSALYSMQETYTFLKTCYQKPGQMGAVFPTSSYAMQQLVKHVSPGVFCLEIGSGTGNVTEQIANKLADTGFVDAVEIDTELCVLAQKRIDQTCVRIQNCSILEWKPQYQYDVVVCTLPFNVCSSGFVKSVLDHVIPFIKPGGHFMYIEYLWLADIKQIFLFGQDRIDFITMRALLAQFRNQYKTSWTDVYANIPPVRVYDIEVM